MGGRGAGRGAGGASGRGVKDDNSEVVFTTETMTATDNVVKAIGMENVQNIADYINGAIKTITNRDEFVTLNMIDGARGDTYAWMDSAGTLGINGGLFSNTNELRQTYIEDVAAGFHPKGTNFNDIAVHEAGHYLDRKLTAAMENDLRIWERASTPIVKQALDNLKANGDKRTYFQIQNSLSGYGSRFYKNRSQNSFVETYAEAIADYGKNKGNANPLSREIVRITREYIDKYF